MLLLLVNIIILPFPRPAFQHQSIVMLELLREHPRDVGLKHSESQDLAFELSSYSSDSDL